jgi:alkaline phosphatase
MVTADHETGGLSYNNQIKLELSNELFSTTGHTAVDVPFYIYNTENLSFLKSGETIDNTDVAKIYRAIIRNI